jgi:glutamyl-Q tRNA(Asp) synthetase
VSFDDEIQGRQNIDVSTDVGDFIIRRRDGLHAYQLAVVVDDAYQNITHVVRGADLLSSTPRQILLQRALEIPTLMYAHLPVVTDANGIKLSKSTGAAAIDTHRPSRELWRALSFLRQQPPAELIRGPVAAVWEWAIKHWNVHSMHAVRQSVVDELL